MFVTFRLPLDHRIQGSKQVQCLSNLYSAALSRAGGSSVLFVELSSFSSVTTPRASALDTSPCVLLKGVRSVQLGSNTLNGIDRNIWLTSNKPP